jgi:hypothetical protein
MLRMRPKYRHSCDEITAYLQNIRSKCEGNPEYCTKRASKTENTRTEPIEKISLEDLLKDSRAEKVTQSNNAIDTVSDHQLIVPTCGSSRASAGLVVDPLDRSSELGRGTEPERMYLLSSGGPTAVETSSIHDERAGIGGMFQTTISWALGIYKACLCQGRDNV